MKKEYLKKFMRYLQNYVDIEHFNGQEEDEIIDNFIKDSDLEDKTTKVITNEANGSLCDNYARCRQSKKYALDCINDTKHSCFKHERS